MDYPPLHTPVIVTLDDGTEFKAVRVVIVDGSENDCSAWATADEFEPQCPPCWDDGICWVSNSEHKPSRQPVAWRFV